MKMQKPTWGCFDSKHLATPSSCGSLFFHLVITVIACITTQRAQHHIKVFVKGGHHPVALWCRSPVCIENNMFKFDLLILFTFLF